MATNNKGRAPGKDATPKTTDRRNPTPIHSSIKAAIVRLALWGVIPASFATWLIRAWRLRHD
jgi:hypothetical protein